MAKQSSSSLPTAFIFITSIIGLLHFYIGIRIVDAFSLNFFEKIAVWLLVLVFFSAQLSAWLSRFIFSQSRYADLMSWLGMFSMGVFSSVLVLTFLRDIFLVMASFVFDYSTLRIWHSLSEVCVLALAFFASLIGLISVLRVPDVKEIKIPIKNLNPALSKFRIVQLSDIHIGPTIKGDYLARIVARVNELKPHAVVITGDLVDGSVEKLGDDVAPLKNLQSEFGTFFVTGNHEYYSGALEWVDYLKKIGIRVLVNEHEVLHFNQARVVLAGVCDYSAGQFVAEHASNPARALSGTEKLEALKIMLAHQPRSADAVEKTGAHLQLSGHTHGGQFWPWNFFVKLQQPYTVGLHKKNNLWIYINRGTGYWGPPKRLGKRSEISVITLSGEA